MPFPLKIQPVDAKGAISADLAKPAVKSRLKRLFERQFPGVLRISSSEKLAGAGDVKEKERDAAAAGGDLEPSSVVLDRMVQSFMEDSNEKTTAKYHRCNCFQGNCDSDDDLEFASSDARSGDAPIACGADAGDVLKGLIVCASAAERNLAADASSIIEKTKNSKSKAESRKILADGLRSLGYDAAVCKSRWEKSQSYPAGEHEYIDVILGCGDDRILIDVDFRSEFEIARSTKSYRALLQSLPSIFVGTAGRASQIVAVVSEAAKQSLKKKGLHFPPWRKPEYMRAKWLASYERETRGEIPAVESKKGEEKPGDKEVRWQPPALRPKANPNGTRVVTGLASVLREMA